MDPNWATSFAVDSAGHCNLPNRLGRDHSSGHPGRLAREKQLLDESKTQFERRSGWSKNIGFRWSCLYRELVSGAERLILYFLAEKRVDFRELVRRWPGVPDPHRLRQVGVRDEAKLKADYGDCGKPVCCNTHMSVMPPVSMRMAKIQKSNPRPQQDFGAMRSLKCCLRFEQDVYDEFLQELPPIGCRVVTSTGQGRVLARKFWPVEFWLSLRMVVACRCRSRTC